MKSEASFWKQIKLEDRKNDIDKKKIRATTIRKKQTLFNVLNKSAVG